MAKKKRRRRRSTSEKVMLVLGILIALSMIIGLVASGLGSGSSLGQAPLPNNWNEFDAEFDHQAATKGAVEAPGNLEKQQALFSD